MEQTSKKRTAKPYSAEFRERAVRLAMEHRDEYQSEAAALTAIAGNLAVRRTVFAFGCVKLNVMAVNGRVRRRLRKPGVSH
jgi:hypothetical protein